MIIVLIAFEFNFYAMLIHCLHQNLITFVDHFIILNIKGFKTNLL